MKKRISLCLATIVGMGIVGAAAIGVGVNNVAFADDEEKELHTGEGNEGSSLSCSDNGIVSTEPCKNEGEEGGGTGGVSWHLYKICEDDPDTWKSDKREFDNRYACHGATVPENTDALAFPNGVISNDDIYEECKGADWYVAFGYEARGYYSQPNGQRAQSATDASLNMPGSVQIGPVAFNTGPTLNAQYNNWDLSRRSGLAASPTNIADDNAGSSNLAQYDGSKGILNNTHISELTAVSMFCGAYKQTTGNTDCDVNTFRNSTGENGMKGKGYFCVADPVADTVTVNIKASLEEEKDCYGRVTQEKNDEAILETVVVRDNSPEDGNRIMGKFHFDNPVMKYWHSDEWERDDSHPTEVSPEGADFIINWGEIYGDIPDGGLEVSFWVKKKEKTESEESDSESEGSDEETGDEAMDEQCDEQCMAWVPDSYLASNNMEGETTVAMGLINDSLTNANNEWHHMTTANDKIATGPIWAKPTDNITWKYCYYPGAQATAGSEVTRDNNHPHPNTDNTLDNIAFQDYSDWGDSSYRVWTEGLKGEADVNEPVTVGKGNVEVSWGTMPNGGLFNNLGWYGIKPRLQPPYPPEDGNLLDPGTIKNGYIQAFESDVTWARREDQSHDPWICRYTIGANGARIPVYCNHTNTYWYNEREHRQNDGWQKDYSQVKVPYNFINDAQAVIQNNNPLYAGETVTLSKSNAHVGTRENGETQGNYATQVPNARARVVAFLAAPGVSGQDLLKGVSKSDDWGNSVGDGYYIWNSQNDVCGEGGVYNAKFNICEFLEESGGTFNPKGSMSTTGVKDSYPILKDGTTYNVFDEAAGNQYCVSAAIYPYAVKNNSDDRDSDGLPDKDHDMEGTDYAWLITEPDCRTIAKKPTFQVWGAGMYAIGDVTSNVSYKNNILADVQNVHSGQGGFKPWTPLYGGVGTETFFSSWVESNLTLESTSSTMASGAATGHNQSEGGYTGPSPWYKDNGVDVGLGNPGGLAGNLANNYCNRSPLSISNYNCNKSVGGFNETEYREDLRTEMDSLHDRLTADYNNCNGENGPVPELCSLYEFHTDSTVPATNIEQGKTVVYLADGDINITGDVKYQLFGYKTIQQIPKMVIFAKNVNIGCNVQRLDALIVAEDNVTTCGTSAAVQSPALEQDNSLQLVVNGAIVSGTLTLNRSYGAATGADSITPAELFNYDSSLYLWSYRNAEAATSGQMTETSSKELAPRY